MKYTAGLFRSSAERRRPMFKYQYTEEKERRYRLNQARHMVARAERAAHDQQIVTFKDLTILDKLNVWPQPTTLDDVMTALTNTTIIDTRRDGSTITLVTRNLDGRLEVLRLVLAEYQQQTIPQSIADQIDARRDPK